MSRRFSRTARRGAVVPAAGQRGLEKKIPVIQPFFSGERFYAPPENLYHLSWRSVVKLCDIVHPPDSHRQAAFRRKRQEGNEVGV
jgi:hypothetical protein